MITASMDERQIHDHFPLPLARGYRRFRNSLETRERHDAAFYLHEVLLKYLSAMAIAHYLAGDERDHRVNAALKGLARPALGEWARFLRECLRSFAEKGDSRPAVKALAELWGERRSTWKGAVRLHNALAAFRTGKESGREAVSLEMLLGEVVAYRNRVLGHGAPLESEHYRRFGDLLGTAFPEVLDAAPFLAVFRLASFDSVRVREGSRLDALRGLDAEDRVRRCNGP